MIGKEKFRLDIEAMLESYPSIRQALQKIDQVVWIFDSKGEHILYASPTFEAVWGRTCESLYADPLTLIKSVHPEDRVKVMSSTPDINRRSRTSPTGYYGRMEACATYRRIYF